MQMPPRRLSQNKELETNLYWKDRSRTVLYYRNPITGKKFYLPGKTVAEANEHARQANALLPQIRQEYQRDHIPDLLDRFVTDYMLPKGYAPRTLKERQFKINRIKHEFSGRLLTELTVLDLRDYLDPFTPHARKLVRLLWIDIYKYAMSEGIVEANLAERTLTKKIPKRERDRLSIGEYRAIHAIAPQWFQIAMDAALLTLQRREDLLNIRHTDYTDGILQLIQQKTGTGLRITANTALDELFRRSRHTSIPSPHLVHRKPLRAKRDRSDHWTKVRPEMLTRTFKQLRDQAAPHSTASWYEIKSLGGRLLIEQGHSDEFVQALMGHRKLSTTQIYLNDGIEWKMAEAGLKI